MAAPIAASHAAVVWLDHWHALIARREHGLPTISDVARGGEPEPEFAVRVALMTSDCDRLVVLGPGDEQLANGRRVVGHYRDHLVALEMEACASATTAELMERLRFLETEEPSPIRAPS